ncbi:transmembrane protein, putative (macronuclear) [Tetrahymena thermophila SB210]|uniref:Transmembrane protein, putative n=1 Tax=Tetrahymena thermophila (strain SB210) TaxID=312017 RepID=W7X7N2_TETTS|nr:transmembrane protein, putative [Tetrahymena thermophila SB210]EWS75370.1 transmembrane protein, putative [Tetrahymena thermophila SB210]|eukprot:XP_012652044.1 transmembrane protein, putative [Tetrahymena thermophila SB210]
MKIQNFILLICNFTLCYAALPINVGQFWFQITEDQSIIYLDSDQNQWVYSRLNQNGDIILSINLKYFMGKSDLNDEYMIEVKD